jgi:chromosome segregation ATPase
MGILSSNPLERRAAQAIFTHALLRWETQASIFLAVAVLIILPDPWKLLSLVGLAGAMLTIRGSLTDTNVNAEIALQSLESQVDLSRLTTPLHRELLSDSLQNNRRIRQLLLNMSNGPVKAQMQFRAADIDGWIRSMYAFAQGAEDLRRQGAFAQDLQTLPEEIRALEWRLGHTTSDTSVIKETLEKKRQSLEALTEVNHALERSDDELRDAEAAIESIYSQLLRMTTSSQLPDAAIQRMSADVEDRAASMKVMADALTSALSSYRHPVHPAP